MSTIHIVLHGLIALAPALDNSGMANHMTALLVDARNQPPEFKECFAPHQPSIIVKMAETGECLAAGCSLEGMEADDCTCKLQREEVSLQVELPPNSANAMKRFKPQPDSSLPFEVKDADDFSYVANLSRLGMKLDPRFREATPPKALIARMTFPFESVSACSLGTRRDEESNNVHPMGFRPIHAQEKVGEPSQALAQKVVTSLQTAQNTLTITLTNFETGNQRKLVLKPIDGEYNIQLVNMRTPEVGPNDLPPDHPCDDGVERDFAFFYDLVVNPPTWDKRLVPHVKYTRWKSAKDLESPQCNIHDHFPDSHPICAMAGFIP